MVFAAFVPVQGWDFVQCENDSMSVSAQAYWRHCRRRSFSSAPAFVDRHLSMIDMISCSLDRRHLKI